MNKDMKEDCLVKIISAERSGNLSKMRAMIGRTYRIKRVTSSGAYHVNHYLWDSRDLEVILPPKKEKIEIIFDTKNLVTGDSL